MKKRLQALFLGALTVGLIGVTAVKSNVAFFGKLATETALAYNKVFTMDLNQLGIDRISMQVSMATQTPYYTGGNFTDGSQSTFSVTITSFAFLVESRSSGTITISSNIALNGRYAFDTISIASNTNMAGAQAFTYISVTSNVAINGATITFVRINFVNQSSQTDDPFSNASSSTFVLPSSSTWLVGSSSLTAAVNLANALGSIFGIDASTISNSTIQVISERIGSANNYFTLQSNTVAVVIFSPFLTGADVGTGRITISSFVGGYDPVRITLFGDHSASSTLTAGVQFQVGASSQITAVNLANAIALKTELGITAATSSVQGASVTITLNRVGSEFNIYKLISSSITSLQPGTTMFFGGQDRVSFSINGKIFISSVNFIPDITSSGTALIISSMINATPGLAASTGAQSNPSHVIPIIISSAQGNLINLTAISTGSAYIYPLFTSSQSALSVSYISPILSGSTTSSIMGGRDVAFVTINGVQFRQGREWFAATSNTDTAISLMNAFNGRTSTGIGTIFLSTWAAPEWNLTQSSWGIVYSTSLFAGTKYNVSLFTSSQSAMMLSGNVVFNSTYNIWGSNASGGTNVTYSTGTSGSIIYLPNNTLGVAQPVLFSTGGANGGIALNPLQFANTYYVIKLDTTNIQLAVTSSGAVAGSSITLTSLSTQAVAHTFTLTPVPNIGTYTGWFEISNDSISWTTLTSVATMTFASPYAATSTVSDIGQINSRYMRFKTSVGTGPINLNITINGKN